MNDLDNKIAEEIDDEALFRLAEGEEREFSPEYRRGMEQLYRKAEAHPRRRMKPIRRIIAIAAIIAMLTGAAAAATFWEEIQQFFVTTFGEYSELRIEGPETPNISVFESVPEEWNSFWFPSVDGRDSRIVSAKSIGKRKEIVFQSGQSELILYQWTGKGGMKADNDATVVSDICVNSEEVYAIEKITNGIIYRAIFWTTEEISFELRGEMSFSELSSIAENIVLIER